MGKYIFRYDETNFVKKAYDLQTLVLHPQIQMQFLYGKGKPMPYLNGEVKKL